MRKALYIFVTFLAGCSTTARFYPVEGPLAKANVVQPLLAVAHGITGNNGKMTVTYPAGMICTGEWSSSAGTQTTVSSVSLMSVYGPVYGSGFSTTEGGGQNPGRAFLVCPDGNQIDLEFITGGGSANGFGVAKDKNGNVFKVLF